MRTIVPLLLTALVAVVAGCGSDLREQATGSVPERDLTLVTPTAQVEVASPVETQQIRAARPVSARRSRPLEPKVELATVVAPVPAAEPVAQPARPPAPANDRELLPGKTVTVIPVSAGPPAGTDEVGGRSDEGRPMVVRGGGTCRGRGRGRGPDIAGVPRPDFR
jgi:nucleoid-associated protein YgaU